MREYLLVDGYNIIHAWDELKELSDLSLESARHRLMDIMCNYQGFRKIHVIIVFDGYLVKGNIGTHLRYQNIDVVYTKEAETADHYIERTVNMLPREYKVRVATSDALEQLIILGHGATRVSARELKNEVEHLEETIRTRYIENKPVKNNILLDNVDKNTMEILEKMRRQKR